jgi:hypothetical protein
MTRRSFSNSVLSATVAAAAQSAGAQNRPLLRLSSTQATAAFDLLGGGLVEFRLTPSDGAQVNPLTWESAGGASEARARGHFLCMDRWGQPSEAEQKNGMPFHGEASRVEWKRLAAHASGEGMEALLPMAQLHIERRASLSGATLTVVERVTNRAKLGRMYNMVQHPSIAPPFLDEETVVDANCGQGFAQAAPDVLLPGGARSVRNLKDNHEPNVTSFAVREATGWVTALSPKHRLVLGYLWSSAQYPWLNLWRHAQNGKPAARGLEFGTTGLHQPFPELAKRGRMLDLPLFAYIDAGETQERRYTAFLAAAPQNASGVSAAELSGGSVVKVQFTS